jgi:CheY-like chemotaxis protein
MFSLRASEKSLDLQLECTPDVPELVFADEGKLRQILINLLGNAIKFTHEGSIILRVSHIEHQTVDETSPALRIVQELDDDRLLLLFEVADTGPGISPEDQSQLFLPFFQTAAVRNLSMGTGLGLAISHQYAALMGGDLTVESEVNVGSTFRLWLPVIDNNASDRKQIYDAMQHIASLAPGQPDYRVLVAEDSPDSRLLLVRLLESVGFTVRSVQNGKECINEWETWHPHLIWMDMRMSEMDGYEAARYIKSSDNGHHTIIIAVTASAFEDERTQILAAGCDDFVPKPFRDTDIFGYMAKYLGVTYTYHE